MDMKISGAGVLSGGEYDEVRISGSAKIEGSIRCKSFACTGAAKGEGDLLCEEEFLTSGSTKFTGAVSAKTARLSGAMSCAALTVEKEAKLAGGVEVAGKLAGGEIVASGDLKTGEDIEAEVFRYTCGGTGPMSFGGKLDCGGLLNAETVEITLGQRRHSIGAIGGGAVTVKGKKEEGPFGDFPPFGVPFASPWGKPPHGGLTVRESIEADRVTLENTACPLVSGREVVIGKGCKIDLVRYSESIRVEDGAEVSKQEKTE